ncbi:MULTISPECIES: branched-chain amino acid transport system II carrier protein [Providencia]|uniref:branched-chain amino acid transport system II carrier protein n=1 Tax=Providencia TaxID=586 RepID=UPI0008394B47|nr:MULTISPECIES: branched-chain amino acid transport system II carrier protein [Providencia]MBP6123003.1 branched-chain amino acid transport system II carrier protein [Providencia sp.]MDD9340133.1 branched-chain amino acid transport system II carrier protein [Providencia heimbachae]NIH21407.1 branched-chain amino acid transport system II carrier protein [Providencia heimbachae]QCJ68998.1 branched-chain amino acid transport system II carrier protein [Providencia heimbachae]
MAHRLSSRDIIALGFMTFALFVGAGNIIFPPMVGLQAGEQVWTAALGFLVTGVGLPVLTIIALAKVGGGIEALSTPIGKTAGLLLAVVAYLSVGPLFATPRTATVSYKVGIAPLFGGETDLLLLIYSVVYFVLVIGISLYPGKLLDSVGHILAPVKMLALAILGVAAVLWPAGDPIPSTIEYRDMAFSNGFINGYLTMDTLGAMVFGIVIVNAARSRGIENSSLLTRYTMWAGLIAGILLTLVYLSLFKLGENSGSLIPNPADGADILHTYVQYTFGNYGSFFLAVLIFVACMVTAVGLTCACAEFFSRYVPISYRSLVLILGVFSMVVSNLGLSKLIAFSLPVLVSIYPPCIVLILMSFTLKWWRNPSVVIAPTMLTSFVVGLIGAVKASDNLKTYIPEWMTSIPLYKQDLMWLLPSIIVLVVAAICDRVISTSVQQKQA